MNTARLPSRLRSLARIVLGAAAALLLAGASLAADAQPRVYVLPTEGIVDQVMAGYLRDAINVAQRDAYDAVLIELDTPGGDLSATHEIVQTLLSSPVPVIVWVGPAGARAASAGTYITLAANVAVMADGARMGAATPIDGNGGDIGGTLGEKILQDTEAMLRSISDARGRDYDFVLTTVTESKSYTADEWLAAGSIDGLAATPEQAVALANGRTVTVGGQSVVLNLPDAQLQDLPMNPLQGLLHLLSDPNVAFILFTLGFYGLLFELQNPNFVTGTLGGIAIVLAFIGFGSLPLNIAGLLLIGIGIVLFIVDMHVTNHGLPTLAGLIAFALGAAALYTEPGSPAAPVVQVALPVIVTMVTLTALFMGLIVWAAMKTRNMQTAEGLIGAGLRPNLMGEVRRPLTPIGSVYAGGEEWSAKTPDERPLDRGTPVRILRQEGLTLIVEPGKEPATNG
ncbi:MAG TPA: nodulation protein NfeD [Candidatus Limnocylindria bacterium]|nr:nodulation protein NfeD [Candidatus Limnocylindria bacterium]